MLDPVINFFVRIFSWIGRGIGWVIAMLLWPFAAFNRWYTKRSWMIKGPIGLLILVIVGGYIWFIYVTQVWSGFDPDYALRYRAEAQQVAAGAGEPSPTVAAAGGVGGETVEGRAANQCEPSRIVEVSADLIEFQVDQNNWVPSMFLSKLGFFGIDWKRTPWLDNKAAFQLGTAQVLRRVSVELVDRLGRVRGTSGINQNLQDARQKMAYDEDSWHFSLDPFGPRSTTQANYRAARRSLMAFNDELISCSANFDTRPDNLLQFLDRITSDIGATSDILQSRTEYSDAGWLDPRADDRFWFAYGQLYAYYGILTATRTDFADVFSNRNLDQIWKRTEDQLRASLSMRPRIISNGNEASSIMPSHLANFGFYLLRVRSNLVETRDILDR